MDQPQTERRWDGAFEAGWGSLVSDNLDRNGFSDALLVCSAWARNARPRELCIAGVWEEEEEGVAPFPLHTLPVSLRKLQMPESRISDWGFLGRLTNLTSLSLWQAGEGDSTHCITDEVVRRLCDMPHLRALTALDLGGGSEPTDAAALCLSQNIPGLVALGVDRWSLTPAGLGHICTLGRLEELDISDIRSPAYGDEGAFTGEGCRSLLDLPKLRHLVVAGSLEERWWDDAEHPACELLRRGVQVV
jgi:hypothetical protein